MLVSAATHALVIVGLALYVVESPQGDAAVPLRAQLAEAPRPAPLTALQLPAIASADPKARGSAESTFAFSSAFASAAATSGGVQGPPPWADAAQPKQAGLGASLLSGLEEGLPAESGESGGDSATFFGVSASGERFVYVVDYSASMEGGRFRRARGELRRSLEELHPTQQFYVVFFNTAAWMMPAEGLQDATQGNLLAARKWIDDVECVGDTDPLPALEAALDMQADAIFFLTDGKFDPTVVDRIQPAAISRATPIHTIGFMNRAGEKLLKEIARRTGGAYKFVP